MQTPAQQARGFAKQVGALIGSAVTHAELETLIKEEVVHRAVATKILRFIDSVIYTFGQLSDQQFFTRDICFRVELGKDNQAVVYFYPKTSDMAKHGCMMALQMDKEGLIVGIFSTTINVMGDVSKA